MQTLGELLGHQTVITIEKYADDGAFAAGRPYDVVRHEGNLLTSGGVQAIWGLVGQIATVPTAFDNSHAYVGVGDSSTASTSGMTDLQAATNKIRIAVAAGSPGLSGATISWTAIASGSTANYAWNELAVFSASSGPPMLNRAVVSGGTKGSGQTWVAIVQITLT